MGYRELFIGPQLHPFPSPSPFYSEWTMNNNSSLFQQKGKESFKIDEQKSQCQWNFSLSTVISSKSTAATISDTLGVIEFDPSGNFIATGGIARKIRIYDLKSIGSEGNNTTSFYDNYDVTRCCICTPAKLSSVKWKPGSGGRVIGSGDYDGVVMEYDLETQSPIFERDEHSGRRIWAVDYSNSDPVLGGSGSDDGSFQIWDPRSEGGKTVATIQPSPARSPVCGLEFNPFGGPLVAVGCANGKVYGYDLRNLVGPAFVFDGHKKAVTYVKFLDTETVISAGTDGSLKMWDVNDSSRAVRTYRGHVNNRSFIGLSVWINGGLLGCGSEDNRVFVYDKRWGEPIWVHGFEPGCERRFVSSVSWRQVEEDTCTLVAGGSDGVLEVFTGRREDGS